MNISPSEAEQALESIQVMVSKTKKLIVNSGAYNFLILWGAIWLIGFLGNHFADGQTAAFIWLALDILGGLGSAFLGIRLGRVVRSTSGLTSGKRIGMFWFLLFVYCALMVLITSPADGKQLAMIIILFVIVGWVAMGLLLSVASIWWALGITLLALFGYYLVPDLFFLWMAVLGGGGMIGLGLYIRSRW
jgi:uncharacterized membrane protein